MDVGLGVVRALYLHVPFCPTVCPYCDFHKMLRHEGLVARYLDRLEVEIAALAERWPGPLDTVYLGGGTPSHLRDAELERVFGLLGRAWGFPATRETTLEADPRTFDRARVEGWRAAGVSRLSIGLQSTDDAVLAFLGRAHDGREGLQAVTWALEAGLRVNADVITAVPGQNARRDLERVAATGVGHMSVYSLTIEPHTPFALRGVRVDPEREADDFEAAPAVLRGWGLERYEVSNFARPGDEARHNLATWRGLPYLGVGPSASSYLPEGPFGVRRRNPDLKGWLAGRPADEDRLDADGWVLERLLAGLRTHEGVDLAELEARAGARLAEAAPHWLHDVLHHGLLELDPGRLRPTEAGLARLDAVLTAFVRERGASGARLAGRVTPPAP